MDGKHFYEYALNDLELCLYTKTKYVLVDDSNDYQVNRALKRVVRKGEFELSEEYTYTTRQANIKISLARNTKV